MGCLDEVEKLTQEKCTKGIRANRVTSNELLLAGAFACAGAGGRPWPRSPSAASGLLDRGKFIWDVGWSPCDEWWRERSFRGKARGPRRGASFLDGRMALFVVVEKSSALWVAGRESAELSRLRTTWPVRLLIDFMGNTPSGRSTATRACGKHQRALPCHAAAREEAALLRMIA